MDQLLTSSALTRPRRSIGKAPPPKCDRKRISRSKGAVSDQKKKRLLIRAYSSEIDLQQLLVSIGDMNDMWQSTCLPDVLCLSLLPPVEREIREADAFDYTSQEIFVFEFGAVVSWGCTAVNLRNILKIIQTTTSTSVEDEMGYVIASQSSSRSPSQYYPTGINHRTSPISTSQTYSSDCGDREAHHPAEGATVLDDTIFLPADSSRNIRLSVSYAIAQSIVLSAFEESVAVLVEAHKYIPTVLAKEGHIKLRSSSLTRMLGDLFALKHKVNLHSDILDTPDFFWDAEDATVHVYEHISRYLEMDFRVPVLNKRLDMLRDLLEVVQGQQQTQLMNKLDWVIIWLLLLEVLVQVVGGGAMLLMGSGQLGGRSR